MKPDQVWADLYRILTTTRCIAHFDDQGALTVDPLTHEEATVLAGVLTAHVLETTDRSTTT